MFIRKDNTLKWNWIAYGAVIALALVLIGIFGLDITIHQDFHPENCNPWSFGNGFLCSVAVLLGKIFKTKMWLYGSAISVILFFIYKAITNEYDFRYAFVKIKNSYVFYVFSSVFMAVLTTGILKGLIGRSRPLLFDALDQILFIPGTFEYAFNSMPSGHTASSFAGLVMIGMLFPKIKWATWTLAILIGVSRVYVGAHWFSDVILGAFIGMVCADIVKSVLKKINSK